jgi:hypothetical protein
MDYAFKHFENSLGLIYCSLRYHKRLKTVTVTWKGTASEEDIKAVYGEVLKMILQNGGFIILNDFQELFAAATEILSNLIRSKWDENSLQSGVRYILHILKPKMEAPILPHDLSDSIKFFYTKLDAVEWIEGKLKDL